MKLIVYNIDFNNLIDYIINIIIVKCYFFIINKMLIKRFKKHINYIKINMLIEENTHFLFYKKHLKINYRLSLFKISY